MPCPYCGVELDAIASGQKPPGEGELSMCCHCGEILVFGPRLTLKKCDLTPEQLADKLGLVVYGTLLQMQEQAKIEAALKKTLGMI